MSDKKNTGVKATSLLLDRIYPDNENTVSVLQKQGIRSVMDLVRLPQGARGELTSLTEAQALNNLYQRALPLAVTTARQFREKRIVGTVRRVLEERSGIQALVEGPTYESQFNEAWGAFSLPGAIDSTQGPVAYLTSLYRYLTQELEVMPGSEVNKRIKLLSRRPDIPELLLDESALNKVEPAISIVNNILERAIAQKIEPDPTLKNVDEALSLARYPLNLPFERYMSQILYVTNKGNSSPGAVSRACDPDYPYFVAMGLTSPLAEDAMRMDSQLGPMQQEILLEAPYLPGTFTGKRVSPRTGARSEASIQNDSFYKRHYGVNNGEALRDIREFCRRTDTNQEDIESLFSIERYLPIASPNIPDLEAPAPDVFGSVFINSAGKGYASVATNAQGDLHTIIGADISHFDRIQRLIRLSRWLGISFDQTDRLLMAAIRVEQQGKINPDIIPTEHTIRALGLFRHLHAKTGITVEDFAALLEGPARYARGKEETQYDRIFNRNDRYSDTLILDGLDFTIIPKNQEQQTRINRLCSAIGIGFETYRYLARFIYQALNNLREEHDWDGEEKLSWNYEVVSAFYRMTILPRYLGISALEMVALLQLLTDQSPQFVSLLAKPRFLAGGHSEITDTLNVIHALTEAVLWCQDHQLDIPWLHQTLLPVAAPTEPTLLHNRIVRQIAAGTGAVLLDQSSFLQTGLPENTNEGLPVDWVGEFEPLLNNSGVVKEELENVEQRVKQILSASGINDSSLVQKTVAMFLDAKALQNSLVYESIGNALELTTSQVRELLRWANTTVAMILEDINSSLSPEVNEEPVVNAELIATLNRIEIRAAVVNKLELSAYALKLYQEHPQIFESKIFSSGVQTKHDVSLNLLFAFIEFQQVIKGASQPEESIIDYLAMINSVEEESLNPEMMALIRDEAAVIIAGFTGLSILTVLNIAREINRSGILRTVRELERLLRIRAMCDKLSLDADAIFSLGQLTPTSSISDFLAAGQKALSSLAFAESAVSRRDTAEMGQSLNSTISIEKDSLVAQSDDKARVRVVIRDLMGEPRKDINIVWNTSLGALSEQENEVGEVTELASVTDENGAASVWLHPGKIQGAARVTVRYGLNSSVTAQPVAITYDRNSVEITAVDGYPTPVEVNAGAQETIEYKVYLKDRHKNLATGETVRWSADISAPQFYPLNSVTDKEGIARTRLKSLHPEENVVVEARSDSSGASISFAPVRFRDLPWLAKPQMESTLYKGVPHEVTCRANSIDGKPLAGVTIEWEVIKGTAEPLASSVTNADGIATQTVIPGETGTLQLKVSGTKGEYTLKPVNSGIVTVSELVITEVLPARELTLSLLPGVKKIEIPDLSVKLNYEREGMEVIWRGDLTGEEINYTDSSGRAVLKSRIIDVEGKDKIFISVAPSRGTGMNIQINIVEVSFDFVIPEQDTVAERDFAEGVCFISLLHKSTLKVKVADKNTGASVPGYSLNIQAENENGEYFLVNTSLPQDGWGISDSNGIISVELTPLLNHDLGEVGKLPNEFFLRASDAYGKVKVLRCAIAYFMSRIMYCVFIPFTKGFSVITSTLNDRISQPDKELSVIDNVIQVRNETKGWALNIIDHSFYTQRVGNDKITGTYDGDYYLPGDIIRVTYDTYSADKLPLIFTNGENSMTYPQGTSEDNIEE
ncbi:Tc toxin subunit A [Enterobacter cloacae]|uniref:Tc toxin subunit A n=1 Tax=Enterobacter cloacae TaxID=550 RepID=UPI0020052225|nr:Tc toxin subunit A [Enterobacter cloacae]MCK7318539.1 Tc toxin subunit A [Enterobacter cloacae]